MQWKSFSKPRERKSIGINYENVGLVASSDEKFSKVMQSEKKRNSKTCLCVSTFYYFFANHESSISLAPF